MSRNIKKGSRGVGATVAKQQASFRGDVPVGVVTKIIQLFIAEKSLSQGSGNSDEHDKLMMFAKMMNMTINDSHGKEIQWRCNLALVCKQWFTIFSDNYTHVQFREPKDLPRLTLTLQGRASKWQVLKKIESIAFMSYDVKSSKCGKTEARNLLAALAQCQTLREIKYHNSFVTLVENAGSCLTSNTLRKLVINSVSEEDFDDNVVIRVSDSHVGECLDKCTALDTFTLLTNDDITTAAIQLAIAQRSNLVNLNLDVTLGHHNMAPFTKSIIEVRNRLKSLCLVQTMVSLAQAAELLTSTTIESLELNLTIRADPANAMTHFQQLCDALEKNTIIKSLNLRMADSGVMSNPVLSKMLGKAFAGNTSLAKFEASRFVEFFDESLLTEMAHSKTLVDISLFSSIAQSNGMTGITNIIRANRVQSLWFAFNELDDTPEFYEALAANTSLRELNFAGSAIFTTDLLKAIATTNLTTVIGFDTEDMDAKEARLMKKMLRSHKTIQCFKSFDPEGEDDEYSTMTMETLDEIALQ
eukprot:gene15604-18539_t